MAAEWNIYRTRFLVKARQLTGPMVFVDFFGREHCGKRGDYLVESSDGTCRIAPKTIFEDIYVAIGPAERNSLSEARLSELPAIVRDSPDPEVASGMDSMANGEGNCRLRHASRPLIA